MFPFPRMFQVLFCKWHKTWKCGSERCTAGSSERQDRGRRTPGVRHRGHLRSIIVIVLSSTTSLVMPADCTLMDTRYLLWGTSIIILSRDFSFSSILENSTSWVSIFRHSMLYPSKSESGGIQEQAMAVEFWGRQCRFCILSGSKGKRGRGTLTTLWDTVFQLLWVQLVQRAK